MLLFLFGIGCNIPYLGDGLLSMISINSDLFIRAGRIEDFVGCAAFFGVDFPGVDLLVFLISVLLAFFFVAIKSSPHQ